jgi:hypothetical protein
MASTSFFFKEIENAQLSNFTSRNLFMKIIVSIPILFLMSCGGNSTEEISDTDTIKTIAADTAIQVTSGDTLVLHEADSIYLITDFKNDKLVFGYKNRAGKTIIKPQFDYAGDFYNGVAPVIKGNKHGLCDTSGKMIHVFEDYEYLLYPNEPAGIYEFAGVSEGMYLVTDKSQKQGCVNTNNELVIPIIYENIQRFSEGLAPFLEDEKYGYLDSMGNIAIKATYQSAQHFHEGLAAVTMNDKIGFIDQSGTMIIKPKYLYTSYFSEGLCAVTSSEDYTDYFYINQTGEVVIKGPFEEADPFVNGEAYVQKRGVCRVIDKTGKELRKVEGDCFARC